MLSISKEGIVAKHLILTEENWTKLATEYGLTPTPIPNGKVWTINDETFVHRDRIAEYVTNDPLLQRHAQTILYGDWPYLADHLQWIAESDPEDVADWARNIERNAA